MENFTTIEQLNKAYPYETFRMKVRERMNVYFTHLSQQEIDEYFNEEETQEYIKKMYTHYGKLYMRCPVEDFYIFAGYTASDLRMMW